MPRDKQQRSNIRDAFIFVVTVFALVVLSFQAGCSFHPLLSQKFDTPLILVPASAANVMDGRGRFREIYCQITADHGGQLPEYRPCSEVLFKFDGEKPDSRPVNLGQSKLSLRVVVVPGILGECIMDKVSPFSDALSHLKEHGYGTGVIPVSGRSSSRYNARKIYDWIVETALAPGEEIVLIGYSKGATDILEALKFLDDDSKTKGKVAAVVSVAGVVSGTPIADRFSDLYERLLKDLPFPLCPPGDGGGVESLSRSTRLAWLASNELPSRIQYFSLTGITDSERVSIPLKPFYDLLSHVDPRNDGQVIFHDAVIPNSTLLGYVKADHWAIALPFSRRDRFLSTALINHSAFPREVLLEAVVRFVEETLLVDKK